jgi:hypothetical protein
MVQADVQRLVRIHWVELQPFDLRNLPRGQGLVVPTATALRDNITLTATGGAMQVHMTSQIAFLMRLTMCPMCLVLFYLPELHVASIHRNAL